MSEWTPTPIPLLPPGDDGRVPHDIGDDMRFAIFEKVHDSFRMDTTLSPEKAAARAAIYEVGVLGRLLRDHTARQQGE